ncbi:hypothetical protein [Bradyrhizobium arachidis]|uniref:Uncharacterized protein n=1 Tax=Bradyrhizobium arachidis TaxID=858423 RepID=A0AAE7NNY4_9BRAD|nr:hypothetical protein [Bradyrhizobium arachidis]QOZ65929.1 hypothetical protein WN72_05510 [Bradyrhizobium arachidis]SFV19505.1 hypothetical protein SAMN05192541_15238 [Bradyrhizobium arachidis]
MSSAQTGFFDSLLAAAKENPLSAALIGGGALWLLVGDDKLKGAANVASGVVDSGASNLKAAASGLQRTAAPPTAPEMDHEAGSVAGDSSDAVQTATASVSEAVDKVRDRFDEGVAYAREQFAKMGNPLPAGDTLTKAQSSLGELMERQPLIIGAIGLAVGAALAGAFRTTQIEDNYIGGVSDQVKDDLSSRGTAVSKALREAADTIAAEASDIGAEAVDRMKQAGTDAAHAAKEKAKQL